MMGGDKQAAMMERGKSVHRNHPPPSSSPCLLLFLLCSPLPPPNLHSFHRLVPAVTKWGWDVALAAIQPDSLSSPPTKCLSGSPGVTTGAFYYSVKWAVKECYGCSYLAIQDVSPSGRTVRGQRGNQPLGYFLSAARDCRNNPGALVYLWKWNQKRLFFFPPSFFRGEICQEKC